MRSDHSRLSENVFSLNDIILHRCEPYARAVQSLSLNSRPENKPLNCMYIEAYYPQKGYGAYVKESIDTVTVALPSATNLGGNIDFLDFEEYNPKHQDMITESVKKLRLKLKERGRKPFYHDKLVSYNSSETVLIDPAVYQQAGKDFIEKQLELVPYFRETLINLMGLDFKKKFFFELDVPGLEESYCNYAYLLFLADDQKNYRELNVRFFNKKFGLSKEELERLKKIISENGLNITIEDQVRDLPRRTCSIDELEMIVSIDR